MPNNKWNDNTLLRCKQLWQVLGIWQYTLRLAPSTHGDAIRKHRHPNGRPATAGVTDPMLDPRWLKIQCANYTVDLVPGRKIAFELTRMSEAPSFQRPPAGVWGLTRPRPGSQHRCDPSAADKMMQREHRDEATDGIAPPESQCAEVSRAFVSRTRVRLPEGSDGTADPQHRYCEGAGEDWASPISRITCADTSGSVTELRPSDVTPLLGHRARRWGLIEISISPPRRSRSIDCAYIRSLRAGCWRCSTASLLAWPWRGSDSRSA